MLDSLRVELNQTVFKFDSAVTLERFPLIEQGQWVDIVLGLSDYFHEIVNWTMVTTPVVLVAAVLTDCHLAVRIVFHEDSVCVGRTLFFLVYVSV